MSSMYSFGFEYRGGFTTPFHVSVGVHSTEREGMAFLLLTFS
jgi:hypothetical protein